MEDGDSTWWNDAGYEKDIVDSDDTEHSRNRALA
jgi:hypothetical protein